jgi:hypothetical protein
LHQGTTSQAAEKVAFGSALYQGTTSVVPIRRLFFSGAGFSRRHDWQLLEA